MVNKVSTAFDFREEGRGLDGIIERLDMTEASVKEVAAAVSAMADDIHADMERSRQTADLFADKLGPEFMAKTENGERAIDELIAKLRGLGFTYDEIEAQADELVVAIRKIDEVKLDTARSNARGASDDVDKLSDSARGANSALANMIGNSAQDLGALSGVAGSAGVALGQMAEYASDAALAGEGLGASLRSMALVAGPIAALTLGVQAISWWLNRGKESQEALDEATKRVVETLRRAKEEGQGLAESLDEAAHTAVEELLEGLGGRATPVIDALKLMGVNMSGVVQAFRDGDGPLADALTRFDQLDVRLRQNLNPSGLAYQLQLEEQARRWGVGTDEAQRHIEALRILNDVFGDQVDTHRQATESGQQVVDFMTAETAAAEAATVAMGGYAAMSSDAAKADKEHADRVEEARTALFRKGEILADVTPKTDEQTEADKRAAAAAQANARQQDAVAAAFERRQNAVLSLIGGDIAVRDAQRDAATAVEELNKYLDEQAKLAADQRDPLDVVAAKIDGVTQAQLRAANTTAEYQAQQAAASGQVLTTQQQIDLQIAALQAQADQLEGPVRDALLGYKADLESLPRRIDVDVNTFYTSNIDRPAFIGPRASGGPTMPGGAYEVAEYGRPEVYTDGRTGRSYLVGAGGHVTPLDSPAPAARDRVMVSGGAQTLEVNIGAINVYPVTGDVAPAAVVDAFAEYLRDNGAYWLTRQLELAS